MIGRRWQLAVSILTACVAAGCTSTVSSGGTTPGSASVSGTVGNRSFQPVDAMATVATDNNGGSILGVFIGNTPNGCGQAQQSDAQPGSLWLRIAVLEQSDEPGCSMPPVAPGSYSVLGTSTMPRLACRGTIDVIAGYDRFSDTCEPITLTPTGGAMTVTSITGSVVEGTFDLFFGGQEMKGQFSAPICDLSQVSGTPKCG